MTHLVEAKSATIQFGGLRAVDSVDMYIDSGEIVALIGPNGAGKTTFFNLLTGIYTPTEGEITFEGKSVSGVKPHVIAHWGISRTFQNIRLFGSLSALENVMVGRHLRTKSGAIGAMFRTQRFARRRLRFSRTLRSGLISADYCTSQMKRQAACRMVLSVVLRLRVRWLPIQSLFAWMSLPQV